MARPSSGGPTGLARKARRQKPACAARCRYLRGIMKVAVPWLPSTPPMFRAAQPRLSQNPCAKSSVRHNGASESWKRSAHQKNLTRQANPAADCAFGRRHRASPRLKFEMIWKRCVAIGLGARNPYFYAASPGAGVQTPSPNSLWLDFVISVVSNLFWWSRRSETAKNFMAPPGAPSRASSL